MPPEVDYELGCESLSEAWLKYGVKKIYLVLVSKSEIGYFLPLWSLILRPSSLCHSIVSLDSGMSCIVAVGIIVGCRCTRIWSTNGITILCPLRCVRIHFLTLEMTMTTSRQKI